MTAQPVEALFALAPVEVGDPVPLSAVEPGMSAIVVDINDASPGGKRLQDLGFLPGTRVEVVRRAPLGDPISFSLRGYILCLRRTESAHIRVRVLADDE